MRPHRRHGRRPHLHLSRRSKLAIYLVLGGAWLSGALWWFARWALARQGEFGREPHPLETWMPMLHGATAFAALWLGGWLWAAHVLPWWRSGQRRRSGVVLIAALAALTASGYLLYYLGNDTARSWASALHWIIGLALAIPLAAHAIGSRRYRRQWGVVSRTYLKIVASEDGLRAAGAQDPEFTGSK
jgi:hypothetical protein